jgi:2-succinyl-5-enolpyruvyl-6-hydroxy-3-cyclohexene-1-carboxylate synthase
LNKNEALTDYVAAFVDELSRSGIKHVVVSPGSRSTPMAILFAEHPDIKVWINIDERSAGFFALGIAKAEKKPVALLCTSGTAAANYFPAVVEARESRVPLLVLTADRPHELRDVGAPQAIDQINIYGKYTKWFNEMALPESTPTMLNYVRTTAERAVSLTKANPSGPVHLNFPFQEPLIPDLDKPNLFQAGQRDGKRYVEVHQGKNVLDKTSIQQLATELRSIKKGLIVCGPMDDRDLINPVLQLGEALGYPVLADPLSQFRTGKHDKGQVIDCYDAILRSETVVNKLEPEVILRFGAMPVSKPYLLFIKKYTNCKQIIIDEQGGWREPTLLASEMIITDPVLFSHALNNEIGNLTVEADETWIQKWQDMNSIVKQITESNIGKYQLSEGRVFVELEIILPSNAALFVGNSMPVRDLDTFYRSNQNQVRTMANRGANGIDGVVSTALGVSAVSEPVVLVIGDLSFYHDINGLLAAKLHQLNITIILVNNDGGGIFSFLPQSTQPQHFEALFGTPIGIDFKKAVEMYEGSFQTVTETEEFAAAFNNAINENGLSVVEVISDREKNVKEHRILTEAVNTELEFYLNGEKS